MRMKNSGPGPGIRALYMRRVNPLLRSPYALILPALALCVAFSILPVMMAVRNSFFNVDYVARTDVFTGIKNYLSIFRDGDFVLVMGNTAVFTACTVIFAIPLAVLAAVFLNRQTVVHNFTQSVVFTPHIISFVSVATLWMFLMDPQFGLLNWIGGLAGMEPLQWMLSPDTSLLSIIIVNVWKTLGYNVLIVISALQGIPAEVYEAARMDRSGRVKTFFHITLPMISPAFVFLVTTSIIQASSAFDLVKLTTGGGPKNSSNLMVYWIYKTGFLNFQTGRAMAGAVVLLVFTGTISALNFAVMNRKAHYQ
jgi:sn-glycerol 3-phosphate transport system permease protein